MKIRTVLLGSSAVLAMVGTAHAQAARTAAPAQAVKAPNYVTVCDAFGLGYMYLPGQAATCFRLQGQIQFTINFHTRDTVGPYATTTSAHDAGWDSIAQGQLTFTAKRMTDRGDLTGVVRVVGQSSNSQSIQVAQGGANACTAPCRIPSDRYVQMDRAYIQWGGMEFGYDSSTYGIGTSKQVAFGWDLNGVTAKFAVEDPRDRWGSRLPRYFWMPDVVASLTGDLPKKGRGNWGFSAGVGQVQQWDSRLCDGGGVVSPGCTATSAKGAIPSTTTANAANGTIYPAIMVWGLSARVQLNTDAIAKGDQLTLSGTVGTGCAFIANNCTYGTFSSGQTMYQVMAQFRHVFTPTLNTTWQITYTDPNPALTRTNWQAQLTWTPINVGGFSLQNQVQVNQTLFPNNTPVLSGSVRFQLQY